MVANFNIDPKNLKNLGHIKANGKYFESLDSLLSFTRKFEYHVARKSALVLGGFESALNTIQYSPQGWRTYPFDRLAIVTVLDTPPSDYLEILQMASGVWRVFLGPPGRHAWWDFRELKNAVKFGLRAAQEINQAADPVASARQIIGW